MNNVKFSYQELESLKQLAGLELYPIGSTYICTTEISPASMFGGDWTCIAENVNLPLGDSAPVIYNPIDAETYLMSPSTGERYSGDAGTVGTSKTGIFQNRFGSYAGIQYNPNGSLITDLTDTAAISGVYVWERIA